ncbi:MAG TPA: DUF1573 domain-containing protein [Ferruginibacter sp.]|nr:DUF1573 domain-containing protein [Ferruginibacter sp.]
MLRFIPILIVLATMFSVASCNVRNKEKTSVETLRMQQAKDAATIELTTTEFDFGHITEGEVVSHEFTFKNIGTTPLIISNATATCGCTIPEKPEAPVMPGETGTIRVKFNSTGRPGRTHKEVTVVSNAQPEFPRLVIKGMVDEKAAS